MLSLKKSRIAVAVVAATIGLTACGGGSSSPAPSPAPAPAPAPAPTNSAPSDISLATALVAENQAGATVGELSATDADSGDTFTFSTDDTRFVVEGTTLKLAESVALNYENATQVNVDVKVTDSANAEFTKTLTIDVEDVLDYYDFESTFMPGESAVSYSGQIARHLLINDLNKLISAELGATSDFDTNGTFTNRDDVIAALNSYFDVSDYDALSQRALLTTTNPGAKQTTLADVSGSSKTLVGKIAGNDPVGQYKDWNTEFVGWGAKGSTTPEQLVREYFSMLADNAQAQLNGNTRQDPFGNDITTIYLTDDGRDLKQLVQKFLLMAVPFSQGVDDYLDDDTAGKGLLSDHTDTTTGKPYTALEHQFDEGFGYFGAARNYLDYSDDEIASKGGREDWQGYHDENGDGEIDFNAEYNFGQSVNAAKRDRGATVATDFTKVAMENFLLGRQLLNTTAGTELTAAQLTELQGYRDNALDAWEKAISATVVHYINDTIADLQAIGTADFSYSDLAKHWSEMKGFALGLQFNRRSPLMVDEADFAHLHDLIGDKPVLSGDAEIDSYIDGLLQARTLLQTAYEFDGENVANW